MGSSSSQTDGTTESESILIPVDDNLSSICVADADHAIPAQKQKMPSRMLHRALQRMPSVLQPIDSDGSLTVAGSTPQSYRSTLRKFQLWTNILHSLFIGSLLL